jgi:hypothetical protein
MSSSTTNAPRLTLINGSISHQNHPNTKTTATIPMIRSTIDDFREIVREQSFITPTNSMDVSIKKYPPLPDISVPPINNTFFRTETCLTTPKQTQLKKQIFNHFASTQRTHLPTLNKRHNLPTMSNVMDLDEDLPQCNINTTCRAATYTSPGDRIISPIKRPSAPSPPTSAQIKRLDHNSFVDGSEEEKQNDECYSRFDDEDSQLFDQRFYHYQQPIIMSNRRIDHYNHNNRHTQMIEKRPTIIITSGHDDLVHPLDSYDFEQES